MIAHVNFFSAITRMPKDFSANARVNRHAALQKKMNENHLFDTLEVKNLKVCLNSVAVKEEQKSAITQGTDALMSLANRLTSGISP